MPAIPRPVAKTMEGNLIAARAFVLYSPSEGGVTYVKCDLCGHDEPETLIANSPALDGPLVRCKNCGLVYVNPRQSDFTLSHAPEEEFTEKILHKKQETGKVMDTALVDRQQERSYKKHFFRERLRRLQKYVARGRLLDVGCGAGIFLEVAQEDGFLVWGIEPSPQASQTAREKGLSVLSGVLADIDFPAGSFEVITMFHVLEHLPSPRQGLIQTERLLVKNGLLVIETPSIDSIWFRMLKGRWRELIPGHYWFFTPSTLHRLLSEAGFDTLSVARVGKFMSLRFFLARLSRYSRPLARGLLAVLGPLGLDRLGFHLNLGDVILVLARKRGQG